MQKISFAKLKQRLSSSVVAMLFIAAQATAIAVPFINPVVAEAAPICVNDQQGANDEPGQKDLTRFCEDAANGSISWNWDELSVNGANTLDGCALFDTDGDGFANKSLCISSTDGVAFTKTIYTCNDSRVDRCAGANTGSPATSSCSLAVTATQPFGAGANSPNDLTATCTPTPADTAGGDLIDVCSYPSGQPNSDPSDCIVYKKSTAKIEVRKVLSPTDDPGLFDLKINGTTYADNVGNGGTTGEVVVDAGSVTVLEAENAPTDLASYSTTLVCRTLNGTNQTALISTSPTGADTRQGSFTANDGDDIVCIFTNTLQTGSIKVVKDVINDNGGTKTYADFHFTLGGNQYSFDPTTSPDGEKTVTLPVGSGPFTITEPEANTMGYATTYSNCANLTVVAGQTQTCTITNNDIAPQLIVKKHVINDNGGTKTAADFTMNVSGTNVSNPSFAGNETGTNVSLNAGNYSVSEVNLPGYTPSLSSDCIGTIAVGETKTCTITNDDQAPSLTLNKIVSNQYGGTATESAWTLTANGPSFLSGLGAAGTNDVVSGSDLKAGTYTLSESGSPTGYSASDWTCTNGVTVTNSQITLANGQTTVCTITNSDIAPIIRIIKQVINIYGGVTLLPDDFDLTLDGNGIVSGADNISTAGSHVVGETLQTGYEFTSFTGENCSIVNGTMTAIGVIGGVTTCTITNTSVQPKLTLVKVIDGDQYGDTTTVNDFGLTVGGNSVMSGMAYGYNAGSYAINEAGHEGYEFVSITGDAKCPAVLGGTVELALGDNITCTIHNKAKAPVLEVAKHVINDNGGTVQSGDFQLFVNGQEIDNPKRGGGDETDNITFHHYENAVVGVPYTLTETENDDYDASDVICTYYDSETPLPHPVTLQLGEHVVCTITNDDIAPKLTVIKHVINDNSGESDASDFTMEVDGTDVSDDEFPGSESGTTVTLDAGNYTVTEASAEGYTVAYSSDCTGTIAIGEEKTCTITNDDVAHPSIELEKIGPAIANQGETITYTLAVENTGDEPLSNVEITDPLVSDVTYKSGDTNENEILDVDETWIYEAMYTIPEDQTGEVVNTAEVCGDPRSGEEVCDEDDHTTSIYARVIVTKYNDYNRNGMHDEGEPLLPNWEFNLNDGRCDDERSTEDFLALAFDENAGCYDETQLTGENGSTTFTDVYPDRWYQLSETIPEDSNWHLSDVDCDVREGGLDGEAFYFGTTSGQTINCLVGNYRDAVLDITKVNNRPNATVVGDTVIYTLTVSLPEDSGKVFGTTVTDLPPEGFTYVPGSWTAVSNLRGNIKNIVTTEPTYGSPGVWILGDMLPGEVVTLTYQTLITSAVSDGTYPDIAFAEGCEVPVDGETECGEGVVYANVRTSDDDPFVGTTVTVASAPLKPAVITQLVNTGSDTLINALVAITLTGAAFVTLVRREQKGAK